MSNSTARLFGAKLHARDPETVAEFMVLLANHGASETARRIGVSRMTVNNWRKFLESKEGNEP